MKYYFAPIMLLTMIFSAKAIYAWDGFDSDSADLVEIIPDAIPAPGDLITINNRDADSMQEARVESVRRNRRTVEVVVKMQNGEMRTLVMEGR